MTVVEITALVNSPYQIGIILFLVKFLALLEINLIMDESNSH